MKTGKRIGIYLFGLAVMTCGQRLFVQAGLGAGAFDSFCVGIAQYNTISAGTWVSIGSVVLMCLSAFLEKRLPNLLVMLSSFLFGLLFDFWGVVFGLVLPAALPLPGQLALYAVGLFLAPLGAAIYFGTDIAKSAYDEIIMALRTAFKLPIWASKNLVEGAMVLLGILVKGPIGLTTVITAFAFGPLLQKDLEFLERKKFRLLQWKDGKKEAERMKAEYLEKQIKASMGVTDAELVLKNAKVINVFTNDTELCDVAINGGRIVGLGRYKGKQEVDLEGRYLCPGLMDGHIHLESSMVTAPEFEKAVLPHGTTAVVTDPHEIANVAGLAGIDFMLESTKDLALEVYFMLPSCVPSTPLDESGACLTDKELEPYYSNERVLGLAEMMNSYGTIVAEDGIIKKICSTLSNDKVVDGHAPFLSGADLNAYITAGVRSDHECSDIDEALEKLRRGQYIMIREGTAAKNLDALILLFKEPYCNRCMLVTDDKHPGDLLEHGHIDYIIRRAIAHGVDPILAVKMATLTPATYFGLKDRGAVAPGYLADLVVLADLTTFQVESVYKAGKLVAQNGSVLQPATLIKNKAEYKRIFDSFCMKDITQEDLTLKETGDSQRVISLTAHELLTTEQIVPFVCKPGVAPGVDVEQDIVKLAVFERHNNSGHVGLGFLGGYGLKKGAVASSVAHDSHNLIIAGTNDPDMMLAGNTVKKNKGGLAFVVDGNIIGELPLPVAGLMSEASVSEVEKKLQDLKECLKEYGISEEIDAFMTLAFVSLPVIPQLRLNTYGVVDVNHQKIVPAVF